MKRKLAAAIVTLLFGAIFFGLAAWSWREVAMSPRERLDDCPDSPNCVSSADSRDSHFVEPLAYEGDAAAAFARLVRIVASMPRTRIEQQTDRYVHATFTTRIMRFVDDVEFLLNDETSVIEVRSASRVGHSDLGANRKRVERIRKAFSAAS